MKEPLNLSDQTIQKVADLIFDADNGDVSYLDLYLALHRINRSTDEFMRQIKPDAILEAEKYGSKVFEHKGFSILVKNDPTRWSFDNCTSIVKKQQEIDNLKDLAKKAADVGAMSIVTDDGEIIEPATRIYGAQNISVKKI